MNADRFWILIISVTLASAYVGYILWQRHQAPYYEAIATFDGYASENEQNSDMISAAWPPKQYGLVTIIKVVRSNFSLSNSPHLAISLDENRPTTNQGRPLVVGRSYTFRFRQPLYFHRSDPFRLDIRESP